MRTLIWVMSIMMLATSPAMAANDSWQPGLPLLDETTTTDLYERPTAPLAFKGTIKRLSPGQATTFIVGGALGAYIGSRLVGYVVGRYANTPDRVAFILMGTMFGTIVGGKWCDEGWWPC